MFDRDEFEMNKQVWLQAQGASDGMREATHNFTEQTHINRYTYQWTWMDIPIIQMPGDILAAQEIIWRTKPDLIIETGIAWGGSTVFYASMLEMIGSGRIVAVDQVLPDHNRQVIEAHRFAHRMTLIEGSSVDPAVVERIKAEVKPGDKVMVVLDSNHTHAHVLDELRAYAPLVSVGCYVLVFDTVIEFIVTDPSLQRPWGKGDNPYTAINAFLAEDDRFQRDPDMDTKIQASYAPGGFVRRIA